MSPHKGIREAAFIKGNTASNTLNGLLGKDILIGNAGTDTLFGGSGDDRLTGGKGTDQMTGGSGADSFVFTANEGNDRIFGFSLAEGDKLVLDDALWGGIRLSAADIKLQFATKGAGEVVLDFGDGDIIHLVGLTTLTNLGAAIEIF